MIASAERERLREVLWQMSADEIEEVWEMAQAEKDSRLDRTTRDRLDKKQMASRHVGKHAA